MQVPVMFQILQTQKELKKETKSIHPSQVQVRSQLYNK
jgi:hypothetical protein